MRKLLNLFLAFILVSMTFAGGIKVNAEESDSIVGYWKLVEIAGEKNVMSREDLETYEQLGSVMYLKFRENGTVKFSLFGDEMEGWWNAYGITLEDSWLTYKIEGDVLTITNADGGDMICERTTGDEINALLGYQDGVLDESVVYSNKETKIMATETASVVVVGYKADMTGFTVYFRCENKTRDSIVISEDKCVLNKYIFHPDWAVSLDSRETLDSEMVVSPAELAKAGISSVDEMILQMRITDAITDKIIQRGIKATAYPTGKKAEEVKAPVRTPAENELIVNDDASCAFIIQGIDPEDTRGLAVNCYLENRSGGTLNFVWTDVTINDIAVSTSYEESVFPGALGYSDVIFLNANLEDLGINSGEITTIKGKLKVYDKTKSTPVVVAEKEFTYTP